jgi:hypothetical protein
VCLERLDVPASAPEIVLGTSPCFYADRSSVFSPDGGSTAAQRLQVQAVVAAVQARGRRWEPEVSSLPCSSSGKEATSAFASASGRWANYFNYGEKDFQELVVDVKVKFAWPAGASRSVWLHQKTTIADALAHD